MRDERAERADHERVIIHHARRELLRIIKEHESNGCPKTPAGQVCTLFRASILAHLAHALRLDGDRLGATREWFEAILSDYERGCTRECHPN